MRTRSGTDILVALAAALVLAACEQAGPTAPATTPGAAPLRAHGPARAPGAQGYTTMYTEYIDDVAHNECAGEDIQFTGTVHGVLHLSPNGNGGYRFVNNYNAVGLKGVGLTSGVQYVGLAHGNFSIDLVHGSEATSVFSLRMIGRGGAPDLHLHLVARVRLEEDMSLTFLRRRGGVVVCR